VIVAKTKPGRLARVEPAAADWRGAFVTVRWKSAPVAEPMERFAIFVFDRPCGGVVWVEGRYVDAWGTSSPAMHEVERLREVAPRRSTGPAFEGDGGNGGWTATIEPYRPGASPDHDRALRWFETEYLPAKGWTWAEEREWVRGSVAGSGE